MPWQRDGTRRSEVEGEHRRGGGVEGGIGNAEGGIKKWDEVEVRKVTENVNIEHRTSNIEC